MDTTLSPFAHELQNKEWPRPCFHRDQAPKDKCDVASAGDQHIKE